MFRIPCPYCQEKRAEPEFNYAGEAHITRPEAPETLDDAAWADYVFHRTNPKGMLYEQWQHTHGCNKFLIVKRNTATNEILGSYPMNESQTTHTSRTKKTTTPVQQQARALKKRTPNRLIPTFKTRVQE